MEHQKKNPTAGNGGDDKFLYPDLTKPKQFPQEPILWQAVKASTAQAHDCPTPVNRLIAQIIAAQWKQTFLQEVCNG